MDPAKLLDKTVREVLGEISRCDDVEKLQAAGGAYRVLCRACIERLEKLGFAVPENE